MPIVLNYTGLRLADAIAGALSTNLSAYLSASAGQAIEITAAEYANLTSLTGTAKYGATDATMATNPPNGGAVINNTTSTYSTLAFNGTYFASNSYLFAFTVKSAVANTAMNYQGLKIKWGAGTFTTVSNYATVVSNVPSGVYLQKYFVIKGASLSPADARFGLYQPNQTSGNVNDLIGGGATTPSGRYSATGDVLTGLSATPTTVYSPMYFQGLMTATKQW